jgi:hypothetical protein
MCSEMVNSVIQMFDMLFVSLGIQCGNNVSQQRSIKFTFVAPPEIKSTSETGLMCLFELILYTILEHISLVSPSVW